MYDNIINRGCWNRRRTMIAFLLLSCTQNEKTEMDTAADIPVDTAEETDTAEQDDTAQDGDTQDPDTIQNTDFPELQDEFNELYGSAIPAPIQDIGNITTYAAFFGAMGPVLELQIMIATVGQDNVTCPVIEGEFAPDGSPVDAITVTGDGCTSEEGKTYSGTMVYGPEGVTYTDYTVVSPSENETCPDVFATSITNGGIRGGDGEEAAYLVKMQSEEISDDCSVQPSTAFLNGLATIDEVSEEETHVNGELTFLVAGEGYSMWFDAVTADEVLNNAVCESEPVSGTNTMTNGVDEVVYTFDGATDCDEEPTQMMSVNGEEAVEVSGAACEYQPMRTGLLGMVFGFGLMLIRRRQ